MFDVKVVNKPACFNMKRKTLKSLGLLLVYSNAKKIFNLNLNVSRFFMHRQRTGLFKESGSSSSDSRRSTGDSLGGRTVLMSQQSKYEYETALNKDASVTLFQFDLAKDNHQVASPQKSV